MTEQLLEGAQHVEADDDGVIGRSSAVLRCSRRAQHAEHDQGYGAGATSLLQVLPQQGQVPA